MFQKAISMSDPSAASSGISISQADWVALNTSMMRLETKLDIALQQHDRRLDEAAEDLRALDVRVTALEAAGNQSRGKFGVLSIVGASGSAGVITYLVQHILGQGS